jgi:hypothetical protein
MYSLDGKIDFYNANLNENIKLEIPPKDLVSLYINLNVAIDPNVCCSIFSDCGNICEFQHDFTNNPNIEIIYFNNIIYINEVVVATLSEPPVLLRFNFRPCERDCPECPPPDECPECPENKFLAFIPTSTKTNMDDYKIQTEDQLLQDTSSYDPESGTNPQTTLNLSDYDEVKDIDLYLNVLYEETPVINIMYNNQFIIAMQMYNFFGDEVALYKAMRVKILDETREIEVYFIEVGGKEIWMNTVDIAEYGDYFNMSIIMTPRVFRDYLGFQWALQSFVNMHEISNGPMAHFKDQLKIDETVKNQMAFLHSYLKSSETIKGEMTFLNSYLNSSEDIKNQMRRVLSNLKSDEEYSIPGITVDP